VAVKVGVVPTTALLLLSFRLTVTVEVATLSATTGPLPVMLEFAMEAASAVKVTVPSVLETGVRIERVFTSALVLASVQVATPEASVTEQAESVLLVPVVPKVGVKPGTGLLLASRNVTLINEVELPLATTGPVPVMFELIATGVPAVKVMVPSVFATGVTMASVFTPESVDFAVHVETPLALLAEQAVSVLPVPLKLKVGVEPLTGLLKASNNVMVTVEVAVSLAITGPVPVMVDVAAAMAPAVKVTVPSAFTIGVAIDNVLISAFVEVNVQVATPLAFVAEQALVVLAVPLAVKVGVTAGTGLFAPSRSVIVIVEVATPSAVTLPVPVMFELTATGAPGSNTTVPPVFATGVRIESVLVSAMVEASVQVATPVTSVAEQAARVLLVPVTAKVGVRPSTGLLFASFNVTVTVDVATPSATTGLVPVIVEFAPIGVPAVKVTEPSVFATGVRIARVLTSALVEVSVQLATPLTSVAEHAP
jgi:hypothetical protein